MLTQRLYYELKPYLPWRFRMALRRVLARRTRRVNQEVWPICEPAGKQPENWPGWPGGKKFACVLTHDVEGPEGLANCRRLAEIEMEYGFRSSFNFIPEGNYVTPQPLRQWLSDSGFEIGVHDLEHDGRLFRSPGNFKTKAERINGFLHEWSAAGFRSGFMLRNLGWLHRLDIVYDSSTFDTDPFELQSNGTNTIFPFWIPTRDSDSLSTSPHPYRGRVETAGFRGGYAELPYTLPQDSTLFLVLREATPEIWLRKLDWIAAHNGMALINVHPDYIRFGDAAPSDRTYPEKHYRQFLEHLQKCHKDQYWHPLARDMAAFVVENRSRCTTRSVPLE